MNPLVVIPARMESERLPGKPLADIHGEPMIVHVWRRAMEADVGPVVVACDSSDIVDAVESAGGRAQLTRADHPSGSDRIFEAVSLIDPDGRHNVIVNVQGDLPTIAADVVHAALRPLGQPDVDIATLVTEITETDERDNPNVVKAVLSRAEGDTVGRALYFSRRAAPFGDGPLFHHIGLYAFRRAALERFVALQPSPLEKAEKLEQLRALENAMRIDAALVDTVPLGVDTPADLERARQMLA
ncbi:MAG: 3-deoxy-manno-octulosonate cytidylyltransferase [Rhodospirillaceae bacterium]|jgi:3-deoxy-manno-octulosonate cytidylyltransferase (CMP-KDO synthetase)|nr:3-deoxy-manno-octulosonate cytidylyltransferase [Rhodospirillaceae bacterium]MBT4219741.1 3-deoxy-manno-octulosonate cytidylyltransferase [Rhodospirillaceae bacterium]MBT4464369.1 3-deoxy-manno-octulosonate cytidylyltransferase [Rhodospirillaceae bacterium]MBT5013180.1 3-deoxy-manno-octulosonate cytidylyltransferase [Rhodospirillaceae bacterium]MBT5307764.1 3-deoxy-manno-octulosonate cytidylyltransferase [Rhodospirillaceae bacterium]